MIIRRVLMSCMRHVNNLKSSACITKYLSHRLIRCRIPTPTSTLTWAGSNPSSRKLLPTSPRSRPVSNMIRKHLKKCWLNSRIWILIRTTCYISSSWKKPNWSPAPPSKTNFSTRQTPPTPTSPTNTHSQIFARNYCRRSRCSWASRGRCRRSGGISWQTAIRSKSDQPNKSFKSMTVSITCKISTKSRAI